MKSSDLITDEVLRKFCGVRRLQVELNAPWTKDGYFGATDGHRMIIIEGWRDYPQTSLKVREILPPDSEPKAVRVSALQLALESLPQVDEMEEQTVACETCEETGEVVCEECGRGGAVCPDCKGTKTVVEQSRPTGRKVPSPTAVASLFGIPYRGDILGSLLMVAQVLEVQSLEQVSKPSRVGPNTFSLGDGSVRVCLMPYRLQEGQTVVVCTEEVGQ